MKKKTIGIKLASNKKLLSQLKKKAERRARLTKNKGQEIHYIYEMIDPILIDGWGDEEDDWDST